MNNSSTGGNTFNGTTTLNNTGAGRLYINNTGVDAFNGNLILTNTGNGGILFGYSSGASTLAAGRTVTIGGSGFTDGILWFERFTQVGPTAQNLTLTGTADLYFAQGSTFDGAITASSPGLFFNGTTFNSTVHATKTGPVNNSSTGGNIFNGTTTLNNTGAGRLYIHNTGVDAFNANLILTNTGNGGILFGYSSGASTLAAGRTVTIGGSGFTDGILWFERFTQVGPMAQNLPLTGTAEYYFAQGSTFNGAVTASAPGLYFNGTTFNSTVQATKTGPVNNASTGGTTFNGTTTLTNTGSGILYIHNTGIDAFNGNLIVNSTNSGGIRFGNGSGSGTLAAGRTVAVGGLGFTNGMLSFRSFTQVGPTPQTLILTGTAYLNFDAGSTFDGDIFSSSPSLRFGGVTCNGTVNCTKTGPVNNSGTGVNTFNGTARLTNTGSGILYMGYQGITYFNGDLLLSSTNSGGIYFGTNGGVTQLAAPRVLAIGASGYTAGPLQLRNFSQLGTVPQSLVLTGTSAIHFLPGTSFNANLALITPSVFLNGSTFNGVTHITKNGPVTNSCTGGNTFNGDLLVQNTSGGNLTLGGSNGDVFNGNVHFIRNGAGSMLAHNNFNTAFPKNISTVGSTNTVQFGGTVGRTLFTGTTTQQFSTDAAWPPDVRRMTVALTGGATLDLLGSVNVITDVAFTSGVVRPQAATSTSNGLLILQNGITFSDPADNNSHVDGYVRKVGNAAFTFPVGNAGILAPISMSAPTGTTSHFTAKYLHADTDPPFDHTGQGHRAEPRKPL